jgi:D-lyxose ketol-isomerase
MCVFSKEESIMKRSEINAIIKEAEKFIAKHRFALPPFANWTPDDWSGKGGECDEIRDNMLGWDITDFGSGDFYRRGLFLFTLRNGKFNVDKKPYAEKIMIVEENQETPMHFHWAKMEDIINRGGGNLVIELYNSTSDESFAETPVRLKTDGVERTVEPGGKVILTPGESICLEQGVYHRFYGEEGKGKVLVGEVSMVNDDTSDNRFYEVIGRFPSIEEDVEPLHLLVSDYVKFIG